MSNYELQAVLANTCTQTSSNSNDYDLCTTYGQKKYYKIRDAFSFWKQYCELANNNRLEGQQTPHLNLAEKPSNLIPLIFDIKLEFRRPATTSDIPPTTDEIVASIPSTEKFLLQMVSCIQETLKRNFTIEYVEELICSLFLPSRYVVTETKIIVNQRIQFPFFKVSPKVQKDIVYPRTIEFFRERNIIGSLSKQPINDWSGIIDTTIADKPIPLYSSSNHENQPTYVYEMSLTRLEWENILDITSANDEDMDIEHLMVDFDQFFIPKLHNHCQKYNISEFMFQTGAPNNFWMPMIFSVNYYYKEMQLLSNDLNKFMHTNTTSNSSMYISPSADSLIKEFRAKASRNKISDIELAATFLKMINPEKASIECYWIDIGRALFACCPDNPHQGLAMWKDFTSKTNGKCPKISVEKCDNLYMSFLNDNPIDVRTLAWYARSDAPAQYLEWHRHWKQNEMMAAIKAKKREHSIVADAFYKTFWLEFLCYATGPNTFTWMRYQINSQNWTEVAGMVDLLKVMSNEFRQEFEDLRMVIENEAYSSQDDDVRSRCNEMKGYLENITSNLCDISYKHNIAKTLQENFNSYTFRSYKDKNVDLMAVQNAVIQCMDTEAVVRPGKPQDYLTKFSKVYWDASINEKKFHHPNVAKVSTWFRQTYPDNDLCTYVVKLFSSCLLSGNANKIIPVMTGNGNNSKSMIKKLIEFVFLEYSYTFPTTILTVKPNSSGNASPEIALADGCKIAWVQEPGKEQTFMSGMLKILSGQDRLFARKLHDNGGNMTLSFTLFIVCNDIPPVIGEKALENRMRVIPHLSEWKPRHLVPKDEEKQYEMRVFPIDTDFEKKIPEMASAALWLFVHFYGIYRREGLIQPEIVTKHTEAYWNETDPFRIFCKNKIRDVIIPGSVNENNPIGDKDIQSKLTTDEVYNEYKTWHRHAYPSGNPLSEPVVIKELSKRWRMAPDENGYWYGIAVNSREQHGKSNNINNDPLFNMSGNNMNMNMNNMNVNNNSNSVAAH